MELHKSKPSKDDFWRGFSYSKGQHIDIPGQNKQLTCYISYRAYP